MSHPLDSAYVRHGVGLSGAVGLAAVAFLFLKGTLRFAVLSLALVDLVVTPQLLKLAVQSE